MKRDDILSAIKSLHEMADDTHSRFTTVSEEDIQF